MLAPAQAGQGKSGRHQLQHAAAILRRLQGRGEAGEFLRRAGEKGGIVHQILQAAPLPV